MGVSKRAFLLNLQALLLVLVPGILCACGSGFPKTLPSSSELGSPLGYRIARSIIHLHTPYSYDACDAKGYVNGVFSETCLSDLRAALCKNRIDFALATDHPDHMSTQTFTDLVLTRTGDTALVSEGGNQINCADPAGHQSLFYVGYEGPLMAVLMKQHETSVEQAASYATYTAGAVTNLKNAATSDALVFFPHTESKSITDLNSFGATGIEVYNLHANLAPLIRPLLGFDAYGNILDLLLYWIDPYAELEPDLALLSVLEVSSVYTSLWNQMLQASQKPTAIAGSDAHQNVLSFSTRDGERVDSFRRLLRWFSNHVLVNSLSRAEIKTALAAGRSWIAFEGVGIPVGMNYWVEVNGASSPVGSTVTYASGQTALKIAAPTLHRSSPSDGHTPKVIVRLRKSTTDGADTVVATSENADLSYTVTGSGVYRVEVAIVPYHLWTYLGYQRLKLLKEYPWIITNPIYINP